MVHRQIGELLVRVDDLTLKDKKLVEESIRLVGNINSKEGSAGGLAVISGLLVLVVWCIIGLVTHVVPSQKWQYVAFGTVIAAFGGFLVALPFGHLMRERVRRDFYQLNGYLAESEKCREFMDAYCRAYPGFARILERHHSALPQPNGV